MKYKWAVIAGIILIAVDQAIKFLINNYYPALSSKNSGIIFGFIDSNIWTVIFLVLGFSILFFLIREWKKISHLSQFGLVLIAAGAISNIIDRITYGGAIDYVHIKFWSSFNLADAYIILGIILYGWQLLIKPAKN